MEGNTRVTSRSSEKKNDFHKTRKLRMDKTSTTSVVVPSLHRGLKTRGYTHAPTSKRTDSTASADSSTEFRARRRRMRLTEMQTRKLTKLFEQSYYPGHAVYIQLASQIGMSAQLIRKWFQNERNSLRRKIVQAETNLIGAGLNEYVGKKERYLRKSDTEILNLEIPQKRSDQKGQYSETTDGGVCESNNDADNHVTSDSKMETLPIVSEILPVSQADIFDDIGNVQPISVYQAGLSAVTNDVYSSSHLHPVMSVTVPTDFTNKQSNPPSIGIHGEALHTYSLFPERQDNFCDVSTNIYNRHQKPSRDLDLTSDSTSKSAYMHPENMCSLPMQFNNPQIFIEYPLEYFYPNCPPRRSQKWYYTAEPRRWTPSASFSLGGYHQMQNSDFQRDGYNYMYPYIFSSELDHSYNKSQANRIRSTPTGYDPTYSAYSGYGSLGGYSSTEHVYDYSINNLDGVSSDPRKDSETIQPKDTMELSLGKLNKSSRNLSKSCMDLDKNQWNNSSANIGISGMENSSSGYWNGSNAAKIRSHSQDTNEKLSSSSSNSRKYYPEVLTDRQWANYSTIFSRCYPYDLPDCNKQTNSSATHSKSDMDRRKDDQQWHHMSSKFSKSYPNEQEQCSSASLSTCCPEDLSNNRRNATSADFNKSKLEVRVGCQQWNMSDASFRTSSNDDSLSLKRLQTDVLSYSEMPADSVRQNEVPSYNEPLSEMSDYIIQEMPSDCSRQVSSNNVTQKMPSNYTGVIKMPSDHETHNNMPSNYSTRYSLPSENITKKAMPSHDVTHIEIPSCAARQNEVPLEYMKQDNMSSYHDKQSEMPSYYHKQSEMPLDYGRQNKLSSCYGRQSEMSSEYRRQNEMSSGYYRQIEMSSGYRRQNEMLSGYGRQNEMSSGYGKQNEMSSGFKRQNETPSGYEIQNEMPSGYERQIETPLGYERQNESLSDFVIYRQMSPDNLQWKQVHTNYGRKNDMPMDYVTENEMTTNNKKYIAIPTGDTKENRIPIDSATVTDHITKMPKQVVVQNKMSGDRGTENKVPTDCPPTLNKVPTDCPMTLNRMPTDCPPTLNKMPTDSTIQNDRPIDFPPTLIKMSTDYPATHSKMPTECVTRNNTLRELLQRDNGVGNKNVMNKQSYSDISDTEN